MDPLNIHIKVSREGVMIPGGAILPYRFPDTWAVLYYNHGACSTPIFASGQGGAHRPALCTAARKQSHGGELTTCPTMVVPESSLLLVVYYYYTTIRGPAQGGLATRHYRAQHGITWQGHDRSKTGNLISSVASYLPSRVIIFISSKNKS